MSGLLISAGCADGCPPCDVCPAMVSGIVTTEEFGSGVIVCFADHTGIFQTCGRHALNESMFTDIFSRVSGTVAGMTNASSWINDAGASFRPTVSYTSGGSLSGIGCLYVGLRGGATTDVPSNASDIATWVQAGGVLFLIVENDDVAGNAVGSCNTLLNDMGACSYFGTSVVPPILCSLSADGNGGVMSPNPSHSWSTATDDQYYIKSNLAYGQEWLYRSSDAPVTLECPTLNADPYGILNASGTLGGVNFDVCLAYETTTNPEGQWYGETDVVLGCGTKTLGIRIYCDTEWKVAIVNVTDATTETYTLDYSSLDPFAATISETLANFCGSDVMVASVSTCTDPPFADCCAEEDLAGLCCIDFDNFPAEGTVTQLDPEGVAGSGDDCTGSAETMGYTTDSLSLNSGGSPYTPSGFVPANGYLSGPWPFDTNPWNLVLYCDSGTLKAFAYDPTNSNEIGLAELTLLSPTCIGGYIEWDDAEALCYSPGGVRRRIDFG